jgi:hypothetical protein
MQALVRSVALVVLLLGIPPASARPQDGIELRWRGAVGDVVRYRTTQQQTTEVAMMPEPVESVSAFVFRQDVKEISPEGVGSLDLRYEAMRLEIGGPLPMSYDSTRTGEAASENTAYLAAFVEPLLGATVHLKVDPRFQVLEITGLQEILEEAFEQMPEPAMGAAFKEMFSDESLRRMIEVNTFPEDRIAVGESWERDLEMEVPMLGTMTMSFENTLGGLEERLDESCARIDVAGELALEAESSAALPLEASLDDGDVSGTMHFALDTGYLVESSMETSMDLRFTSGAGGMDMQMSMTMKQSCVRIGADDPLFE